jgi:hypothetical protein
MRREDLPTPAGAPAARAKGPAKAQPTAPEPPQPPIDVDAFRARMRDHERARRLDELGRRNAEAFVGQQRAFAPGNQMRNDADWRGW